MLGQIPLSSLQGFEVEPPIRSDDLSQTGGASTHAIGDEPGAAYLAHACLSPAMLAGRQRPTVRSSWPVS